MTIEKLKSGSYRIRQMENGKLYLVTVPYKPSKKEAISLLAEKISNDESVKNDSFASLAKEYIEVKKNVLSVRTVREYKLYINRLPEWFVQTHITKIDQLCVQKCVNELSERLSPKTVSVLHGFISSVLSMFRPNMRLATTLPQRISKEPYIPTEDEVKKILEYTKENNPFFFVALSLATMGLRRSEICALDISDLDDNNMLNIDKALVEDENKDWIVKTTKTEKSTRVIPIKPDLADYIREQGYFYKGKPQSISNYLLRVQKELNINHFSVHKLRHFFCSQLIAANVSFKDIQYLGGWSTDETIKKVYGHAVKTKTDEGKRQIMSSFWESIN